MSKRFEFERFNVIAIDTDYTETEAEFDGEWVKAQDALDREAVLQAQIRTLEAQLKEARSHALDDAAKVVAAHNREGRGWIPGSLWDTLANEAAARVRALKVAE